MITGQVSCLLDIWKIFINDSSMSLFILTVDLDVLEPELVALDRDTRVPIVLLAMSGHRLVPVNEGGKEGLPVFGRHDVVDDRVDCRIQIEKYPRDVKKFLINGVVNFIRHPIQPDENEKNVFMILFLEKLQFIN